MTDTATRNCIQILTYIRRRRDLTPEQFYRHWKNTHAAKVTPWAEKHGIIRYQQIHMSGSMVPIAATVSAPNAISTGDLPTTPIEFDGITMFLVPTLEQFTNAFKDPYFIEVIEPDGREMLDKAGPGSGIVASFQGQVFDVLHRDDKRESDEEIRYRTLLEDFDKRQKK